MIQSNLYIRLRTVEGFCNDRKDSVEEFCNLTEVKEDEH